MGKNNTMPGITIINDYTYGEAELAECIRNHGLYINDLMEDFIHHYKVPRFVKTIFWLIYR